jgi:hypothetical protein
LKYGAGEAQVQDTAALAVDVTLLLVAHLADTTVEKQLEELIDNLFQGADTTTVLALAAMVQTITVVVVLLVVVKDLEVVHLGLVVQDYAVLVCQAAKVLIQFIVLVNVTTKQTELKVSVT